MNVSSAGGWLVQQLDYLRYFWRALSHYLAVVHPCSSDGIQATSTARQCRKRFQLSVFKCGLFTWGRETEVIFQCAILPGSVVLRPQHHKSCFSLRSFSAP